ncbi:MAG: hypothetical protein J1F07_00875 [Muribaculaceae bacterium]|nr:hypothetical protein [Muribaculaceae bacterium]
MENYVFDEDKALAFIREAVGQKISEKYTDDDILFIIDTIWDYYENKGFLSLDMDETEEEILDSDDLIDYVKKEVAADDEIMMDPADISLVVKAELEYEESLEDVG